MKASKYVLLSNRTQQQSQATEVFNEEIELGRSIHSVTRSKTGANIIGRGIER